MTIVYISKEEIMEQGEHFCNHYLGLSLEEGIKLYKEGKIEDDLIKIEIESILHLLGRNSY